MDWFETILDNRAGIDRAMREACDRAFAERAAMTREYAGNMDEIRGIGRFWMLALGRLLAKR